MVQETKKKKSLLDDEGEDLDNGPANLGIRVNKQYAARFEHNKRREELHRLQAKYPEEAEKLARKMAREAALAAGEEPPVYGDEEADSEDDEEEDEGEIPSDTEAQIFDTLLRIRRKDPAIYQKDVAFFNRDQEEGEGEEGEGVKTKPKKEKPMYLKDLIAKQALEYGPELGSSDEEEGGRGRGKGGDRHPKAYDAEQEELRKAFLTAVDDAGEEGEQEALGGVLRVRSRAKGASGTGEEGEGEGQEGSKEGAAKKDKKGKKKGKQQGAEDGDRFQQLINAYFGDEEQLNPDDKFLKEYIVNKGWVDKDDDSDDDGEEGLAGRRVPRYHQLVGDDEDGEKEGEEGEGRGVDDEEDERYLRQMDVFEAKYNFRYEEPGADRIMTHPRVIEGAVRKPDDRRKRSRESKKARQEAAEAEAREELKRLKNLKKGEIAEKLEKLRTVAGAAAPGVSALDEVLEGDFDPEAWDAKMAEAFGEDYYEAEDDLVLGEDEEHPGDMLEGISDISELEEEEDAADEGAGGSRGARSGSEEPSGAGASEDGEEGAAGGGGKAVKFKVLKKKLQELDKLAASVEGEGTDAGDGRAKAKGGKGGARPDAAALAAQRAELQRLLEDYYRLDYEDNVGGVKTRFRYKQVPASTFGLSVEELLSLDDKQLNAVVGMKRLAPYRDDAERMRPNYKALTAIKGELAAAKGGGKQRRQDWKRDRQHPYQHKGGPGGREWQQRRGPGGHAANGEGAKHGGGERRRDGQGGGGEGQGGEGADGAKKRKERAEDGAAAAAAAGGGGEGQGTERGVKKARKEQNGVEKSGEGQQQQQRSKEHRQGKEQGGRGKDRPHKTDKPQRKEVDPQAARLASYAVPTLKKESDKGQYGGSGGQGGKKRKHGGDGGGGGGGGGAQAPASDGPQLTRAQKKNLKRTQKRAEKRQGPAEGA